MRGHAFFVVTVCTAAAGFPQTDEWRSRMAAGAAAETAGEYAAAVTAYRGATELAEPLDRRDARRTASWNALASMYDAQGKFPEAESAYRRALRAAEEMNGKSGTDYAFVLGNLASFYVEAGQIERGEKLMREAYALQSAADPPDSLRLAISRNGLAEILVSARNYPEAERLLTASLATLEKFPDAWGVTVSALNSLAVMRLFQNRNAEAERLLRQALGLMESRLGPDHPMLSRSLYNLAAIANHAGNRQQAGAWLRRALDIAERRLGPEHPMYGILLANYATLLRQGGEKSRAKELEARSTQILKESGRRNGIGAVVDITALRRK